MESMTDPNDIYARMRRFMPVPKYVEFDSKEVLFGQAADIAAGIVSTLMPCEGVTGLITRFEYVTYNGKRAGHSDLAKINYDLGVR